MPKAGIGAAATGKMREKTTRRSRVDEISAKFLAGEKFVAPEQSGENEWNADDRHAMPTSLPHYLTLRELAEISGIGERHLRRMFHCQKLRGWRAPGQIQVRFTLADLLQVMERV